MSTEQNQPQVTYLFDSEMLFPRDRSNADSGDIPHSVDVEPLKYKCINVAWAGAANFMGAPTWDFQIEGGVPGLPKDQWFRTHYDWSLVENTPGNLSKAVYVRELLRRAAAVRAEATQANKSVAIIKVPVKSPDAEIAKDEPSNSPLEQ